MKLIIQLVSFVLIVFGGLAIFGDIMGSRFDGGVMVFSIALVALGIFGFYHTSKVKE